MIAPTGREEEVLNKLRHTKNLAQYLNKNFPYSYYYCIQI